MPFKNIEARREWQRKNYQANKEVINSRPCKKEAHKRYAERHKDKRRQLSKEYFYANRDKMAEKVKQWWTERGNERKRKETELLTDDYVIRQLTKDGFTREEISQYPELIETKRILLKTKRLCKTSPN